ncbi:hypothetical protein V2J09_015432 [Rumex salicifolius]
MRKAHFIGPSKVQTLELTVFKRKVAAAWTKPGFRLGITMERACSSMRRATALAFANPLLGVNASFSNSTFKPPSISFFSSNRCFLSTAACSRQSVPIVSIHDETSFPFHNVGEVEKEKMEGSKQLLKGMRYAELENWVQSHGFRPGQALMLWKRLYGDNIWANHYDELEGLNKDFKKMLSKHAEFKALSLKDIVKASDGTRKILFTLEDGMVIETVVIPCPRERNTVCVSSQVGCAMNCQMGLKRHLTAAEIVEQAVFARRLLTSEVGNITNVVFMGMGEPLHNIENVIRAADIMVDEHGLHFSPRKVTVSTSGLVPQLKRFLHKSNCALAVSLNATTDEVRNWIMPINRKYNLNLLLGTLREELRRKHNGSFFKPTSDEKMIEFRNMLAAAGITVLMRPSRGDDKMAACGQLGKPGDIQAPLFRIPAQFQSAVNA